MSAAGPRMRRRSTAPPWSTALRDSRPSACRSCSARLKRPRSGKSFRSGKPSLVLLPHQNAPQVRVAAERECRTCRSIRARANPRPCNTGHTLSASSGAPFGELGFEPQEAAVRERAQVPDDVDRLLGIAELDRGDVREIVVYGAGARSCSQRTISSTLSPATTDGGLAPHDVDAPDASRELRAIAAALGLSAPPRCGTSLGVTGCGALGSALPG